MPSPITKLLASPAFKYVVFALTMISGGSALASYLRADGHVQAATIVAACVAAAGHILQFLSASGLPTVTVEATTHIPDPVNKVQAAADNASLRGGRAL